MRRESSLSGIYTMAVAGVFLAGFFLTVIFGAQTYREIADGQNRNNEARALLSYISTCVRMNDTAGAVSVSQVEGEAVLTARADMPSAFTGMGTAWWRITERRQGHCTPIWPRSSERPRNSGLKSWATRPMQSSRTQAECCLV